MVTAPGRGVRLVRRGRNGHYHPRFRGAVTRARSAPGTGTGTRQTGTAYSVRKSLDAVHQGLSGAAQPWFVLVRVARGSRPRGDGPDPADREE